jgi:RNA polymerase sigma-70 factor (ECF subfamily)
MRAHALSGEPAAARAASPAMDEGEFLALYERSAPRLRAYLRRLTGDASLADDVLQEAYLRLLQYSRLGASDGERIALLFRAGTNLVYDHWRRKRREREKVHAIPWGPHEPAPLALGPDMARVFERLRPRDRALLWLTHVEGCSHREVARILGVNALSVRVLLFRARATLKRHIRRAGLQPREDRRERTRP